MKLNCIKLLSCAWGSVTLHMFVMKHKIISKLKKKERNYKRMQSLS